MTDNGTCCADMQVICARCRRTAEVDLPAGDAAADSRRIDVAASCSACHHTWQVLSHALQGVQGCFNLASIHSAIAIANLAHSCGLISKAAASVGLPGSNEYEAKGRCEGGSREVGVSAAAVHEASSVLARLWFIGCMAVDLLPSLLTAQCSACSAVAAFRYSLQTGLQPSGVISLILRGRDRQAGRYYKSHGCTLLRSQDCRVFSNF